MSKEKSEGNEFESYWEEAGNHRTWIQAKDLEGQEKVSNLLCILSYKGLLLLHCDE